MCILHVDITKRYSPDFTLAANFASQPGFTVIFGASGAGKTSLLNCIAGLATPDRGSVKLSDQLLYDSGQQLNVPVEDREIGYVFQTLALFPHLSVLQNICYGIAHRPEEERGERALKILTSFGIAHLAKRRPHEISGGERQRVALARTLVTEPKLLLLDEPLSALDRAIKLDIIDDLKRWSNGRSTPILYVTHSYVEAAALNEHAVLLQGGKVKASGEVRKILQQQFSPMRKTK